MNFHAHSTKLYDEFIYYKKINNHLYMYYNQKHLNYY